MIETVKKLKDMNDTAIKNSVAIELQQAILTAQAEQMALLGKVQELERKVTANDRWDAEKSRYRLAKFVGNTLAYVLLRSEANSEPGHALCANCFNKGFKSILQSNENPFMDKSAYICPSCKYELKTHGADPVEYAD